MGDFQFNVSKGKAAYYAGLPAASDALIAVLLKSTGLEADATLKDHDTLASVLAGGSTECDFTNYSRQTLTTVSVTVDDTNDWVDIDSDDITWTSAGGASNNTIGKLLICYDGDTGAGTDADIVPLYAWDYSVTTDGNTLLVQPPAGGFGRAA